MSVIWFGAGFLAGGLTLFVGLLVGPQLLRRINPKWLL